MTKSDGGPVQLEGNDLARAEALVKAAQEAIGKAQAAFTELGVLVRGQLGDTRVAMTAVVAPPEEAAGPPSPGFKATYYDEDGHCLYVMENPPGICRPCTDTKPGPTSPAPPAAVLLSE